MFTAKEQELLSLKYFRLVMLVTDACELESETGDHWLIIKKQFKVPRAQIHRVKHQYTFMIYHRHKGSEGFHSHLELDSALSVVLEILAHDDYRTGRTGRTAFDTVKEKYQDG